MEKKTDKDLELIYRFARKHKLKFMLVENFDVKTVSVMIPFDTESDMIIFDYWYDEYNDYSRIMVSDKDFSRENLDEALKDFENLILLHKKF